MHTRHFVMATAFLASSVLVQAAETPIGKHQIMNNMEIGAVYLQPIKMEPAGMMLMPQRPTFISKPIFMPPRATRTVSLKEIGFLIWS